MQLEGNNSCVVAFEWQSFEEIDVKNLWEFSEIKMSIKKTKKEMEEEAKKKLEEMKKKKVKKLKQMIDPMAQSAEAEQAEIDALKADIEEEVPTPHTPTCCPPPLPPQLPRPPPPPTAAAV